MARQIRRRPNQSGFLMIDSLIALCVVVVSIVPIESLLVGCRTLDQQAQLQTVASNAAEMEIENLRTQAFSDTAAMTSGSFTMPTSVATSFPNTTMTGNYSVTTVSGLGSSVHKVLQVVVTVNWTRPDNASTNSSVTLDSYITQGAFS